ncbi:MAG: thiamine diphosphokinase [Rhodobacterales bacterium]|nr:thiamine diphosphokinase [Rhodobacterales bacterium]
MDAIVHEMEPVTLVGGGPCDDRDIRMAVEIAPIVVAADGGAGRALACDLMPKAVIGDLDSIDQGTRRRLGRRVHRIAEQDTTDFDKALRHIIAPLVIGVGFSGGRLDHQLAVLNGLVGNPDKRCVLIGAQDIVFLAPSVLELDLPVGSRISLFPMARMRGTSQGLRWAIDGVDFAPDGRIGTSNEVSGPVRLSFEAATMLVILPVAALAVVVAQLRRPSARWSVHAEPYKDPRPE